MLDVHELAKTLGEGEPSAVLRGVNFRVEAGRWLGLRGSTGSGKTTLLRLIAGLEVPDHGEIRLEGQLASARRILIPPGQRGIGFVFQHLGLWPHLTVAQHLDYVLDAGSRGKEARALRRGELLASFHLKDLAGRYPAELSGGEKHLLALARALAGEVRLLLLDEPFAGLDGQLKEVVLEALRQVRRRRALAAILVSHDPEDLRALCDGVLSLREGRVVEPSLARE